MEERSFSAVSHRAQLTRMRDAAGRVLREFGITDARLRVLHHDFNTTLQVDAGGRRYALRINLNSHRPIEAVEAEVAWVAALGAETDIRVPEPQPTTSGGWVAAARCEGLDRDLPAVLFSWLEGRNLGRRATKQQIRAIGRLTAKLHDHAERWTSPARHDRPEINSVLMDSHDHLTVLETDWYDDRLRGTVADARVVAERLLEPIFERPTMLLHADLHVWNTRWHGSDISVFDFDDCGHGTPVQDLAISAFYLRSGDAGRDELLFEGYAEVREPPRSTLDQFEALIVARNLVLMNEIAVMEGRDMTDFAPAYFARSARRLDHWLRTGYFTLNPPEDL